MRIKSILSLTTAVVVASIMTGCGGSAPKPQEQKPDFRCKQENVLAPEWTCTPQLDGYYAGLGVAQKSAAGMGHMRRVALANGRSDLAQQIKSQVKDKVETFTGTTGIGKAETVDTTTKAVSKQLAKVDLQGSKGVKSWTAPSGALYLLVVVPESSVNKVVKDTIKTSLHNDSAAWQQFQAKNAMQELDKAFPTDK